MIYIFLFISFVNCKLLKPEACVCVEGTESSISLCLCGSEECSPQLFPDVCLCVDAGDTALGKLDEDLQNKREDRGWTGAMSVTKGRRVSP